MEDRRAGSGDNDDDDDDDDVAPPPVAALLPPPPPPGAGGGAAEAAAAEEQDAAAEEEEEEANGQEPDDPGFAPPGHDGRGGRGARRIDFCEAVRALRALRDAHPMIAAALARAVPEGEGGTQQQGEGGDIMDVERDEPPFFRRFVGVLGQREGGGTVGEIVFLLDSRVLPDVDVERLVGEVTTANRTLQELGFFLSQPPNWLLRALTEDLPSAEQSSLAIFHVRPWAIDPAIQIQLVQPIVGLLSRNTAIANLLVVLDLDADQCKLICQALRHNTNLQSLCLVVKEIFEGTLDGVAASPLQQLRVEGSFSDGAVSSLARQLRTNETLQHLRLDHDGHEGGGGHGDSQELLDLAKTYNFTLRTIGGNRGSNHVDARVREQLQVFVRRNDRVRKLLHELQSPYTAQSRRVVPRVLLPSLLGPVSDLPTALYRILRMGNVHTVSNCLAAQGNDDGPRRSRRRRRLR